MSLEVLDIRKSTQVAMLLLALSVISLSVFGLVMLYSTTAESKGEYMIMKQGQWIIIGMFAALGVSRLNYQNLLQYRHQVLIVLAVPLAYLAFVHLLSIAGVSSAVLNKFPMVRSVNGAYRWLFIGPYSVQPGELTKLGLILYIASYFGQNPRNAPQLVKGFVKPCTVIAVVLMLILLGGSLSITFLSGCLVMAMLFVAGVRLRYFIIMIMMGAILVATVLTLSPNRLKRVTDSWLNPAAHKKTSGYQLYHSQIALGSGGPQGLGLSKGIMKRGYLPESHTDFIMAVVGEELGLRGIVLILAIYALLVACAFVIAAQAVDRQGLLIAFGIGFSIGLHALLNVAVVSGAMPTTGVTAPFVSYGGSNMMLTWLGIGLLYNVAIKNRKRDRTNLRGKAQPLITATAKLKLPEKVY